MIRPLPALMLALLLVSGLPSIALAQAKPAEGDGQVFNKDGLKDFGYGFEFFRLSPEWSLHGEGSVRRGVPGAVAGIMAKGNVASLVVLPREGKQLLPALLRAADDVPVLAQVRQKIENLVFEGRTAMRIKGTGRSPTSNGKVEFTLVVMEVGGRVLELRGVGAQRADELEGLFKAFRPLPERKSGAWPGRQPAVYERAGPGWRQRGPHFETLRGDFALGLGPTWLVEGPDRAGGGAEVVAKHPASGISLRLSVVRGSPGEDPKAWLARLSTETAPLAEGVAISTATLALARGPLVCQRLTHKVSVLVRGHVPLPTEAGASPQALAFAGHWTNALPQAREQRLVREALDSVKPLTPQARQALSEVRAALIASDRSLHARVFTDYALDLRLKLPAEILWRVDLPRRAPKAPALGARLRAVAVRTGITVDVHALALKPSEGPPGFHARLLRTLKLRSCGELPLPDKPIFAGYAAPPDVKDARRVAVLTSTRNGTGLAIVAYRPPGDIAPISTKLLVSLQEVELLEGLKPDRIEGRSLIADRLGIRLDPPAGFLARLGRQGPQEGSAEIYQAERGAWLFVVARAASGLDAVTHHTQDLRWLRSLPAALLEQLKPGDIKTVKGRPCAHEFVVLPSGERCDLLRIDGALHTLVVLTDRKGRHPRDNPLLASLSFVK